MKIIRAKTIQNLKKHYNGFSFLHKEDRVIVNSLQYRARKSWGIQHHPIPITLMRVKETGHVSVAGQKQMEVQKLTAYNVDPCLFIADYNYHIDHCASSVEWETLRYVWES